MTAVVTQYLAPSLGAFNQSFGRSATQDWPASAAAAASYAMRGWDSGAGVWVYWQTSTPSAAPTSTSPAATGAIVNVQIVG